MDSLRSNESMVVVVRRSLAITFYYGKNVIWNDFKSNHKISNQIQIKSHVFQIKSLFFKSIHYVWFNHDLNHIMIWICPRLLCAFVLCLTFIFSLGRMASSLVDLKPHPALRPQFGFNTRPQTITAGKVIRISWSFCKPLEIIETELPQRFKGQWRKSIA